MLSEGGTAEASEKLANVQSSGFLVNGGKSWDLLRENSEAKNFPNT
jgi:hypothetical protein